MEQLSNLVNWIELHGTTVDLIQWLFIGLLAWVMGAFRFLYAKLKRPTLEIESFTSRCSWEDLSSFPLLYSQET